MKIQMSELRSLLRHEIKHAKLRHLREEVAPDLDQESDSLDAQIDAYLVKLEKKSSQGFENKLENLIAAKSLRMLFEADDEDDKGDKAPVQPPKQQPPQQKNPNKQPKDPATGDTDKRNQVNVVRTAPVSAEEFANHVARLVENYDSLLNVKRTILVRAIKYAKDKHSEELAGQMAEILESRFGMSTKGRLEREDEQNIDPPVAIGGNAKLA
jgi:hypothetical protein